ncbi:DUF4363 family protein [Lachnospiraceae bacterium MD1]|uniref:DUF4363 family protein n=1 Tax=Variimorphobacter saccharofermentans TaxID=2755051 RepID=A0A839K3G1_9FIRM|nr:DUF4363 family protein [Variimorphobacter saccharofermentans]MBB2183221.1 DUF4363 family protein [Variimorphobacter saccharofermentans]
MRRFLTVAIPTFSIAIFICIMLSSGYLKKPFGEKDNISQFIYDIKQAVANEEWDVASNKIEILNSAWKDMIFRIQFSSERDEINYLSTSIARLRGAIEAEDKAFALVELNEAYNYWVNIGN